MREGRREGGECERWGEREKLNMSETERESEVRERERANERQITSCGERGGGDETATQRRNWQGCTSGGGERTPNSRQCQTDARQLLRCDETGSQREAGAPTLSLKSDPTLPLGTNLISWIRFRYFKQNARALKFNSSRLFGL